MLVIRVPPYNKLIMTEENFRTLNDRCEVNDEVITFGLRY